MFAKNRSSQVLADPNLMMIPVYEHRDMFKLRPDTPEDVCITCWVGNMFVAVVLLLALTIVLQEKIPKVFHLQRKAIAPPPTDSKAPVVPQEGEILATREEFIRNFNIFTENQLKDMNWNSIPC